MKSLPLWEVLIPCANNDGAIYSRRHTMEWEKTVLANTGGLSKLTPIDGVWSNGDKGIYRERMTPYRVRCDEDMVKKLVKIAGKHFDQLAMMFYAVSNDCRIVEVA